MSKLDTVEREPLPPEPIKYRYVCHGCTETALFSTSLMQGIQITCQHCGKQQETVPANWVIL